MAQINGKYQWVKTENMKEFLEAQGVTVTDDLMRKLNSGCVTINLVGNRCSITHASGSDSRSTNFTFGESFEEDFGTLKFQSIASFDGEKIVISSRGNGNGKESVRTYEFADRGCKITHSSPSSDVAGYRYFKLV